MDEASDAARKASLRQDFLRSRAARSLAERAGARAAICAAVLERSSSAGWRRVAAYEPMRTEPGSVQLLAALVDSGVEVLVPLVLADRDLDWACWNPAGAGAPLGPDAIASVDAVLVPALAVALDGARLGRGGGSYDRALARCADRTVTAALLFDGEVVGDLPREPWDRPVTAAVTPRGWTALGAGGIPLS